MTTHHTRLRPTRLALATLALLTAGVTERSDAQPANAYKVKWMTSDITDGGTDDYVLIKIRSKSSKHYGFDSTLDWIDLDGSYGRAVEGEKTFPYLSFGDQYLVNGTDGHCVEIKLKCGAWGAANDWGVRWISVTHVPTKVQTYFEFGNRWVTRSETPWLTPSSIEGLPKLVANPQGDMVPVSERVQVVKFYNNELGSAAPGATVEQSWQFGEEVGFSTETSTSFDASLTLTYESPQTVAGTFGAEVTAAYGEQYSKSKNEVESSGYTKTITLNWSHPERASILKVFNLQIPWEFQNWSVDNRTLRMKKLGGMMSLAGNGGKAIEIPQRENGKIVPIGWDEIQELLDIMAITEPDSAAEIIRDHKQRWIDNGYVSVSNPLKVGDVITLRSARGYLSWYDGNWAVIANTTLPTAPQEWTLSTLVTSGNRSDFRLKNGRYGQLDGDNDNSVVLDDTDHSNWYCLGDLRPGEKIKIANKDWGGSYFLKDRGDKDTSWDVVLRKNDATEFTIHRVSEASPTPNPVNPTPVTTTPVTTTPVTTTPVTTTLVSGVYRDSHGDYVELSVAGSALSVEAYSDVIRKYWQTATGTLVGSKITNLVHWNKGARASIGSGTVSSDGRRIDFANGTHWVHVGANSSSIPVADRNPGDQSTGPTSGTANLTGEFRQTRFQNDNLTVRFLVKNEGDAPSVACSVHLVLSKNKRINVGQDEAVGTKEIPTLQPGESTEIEFSKKIERESVVGNRLIASIDSAEVVVESNEEDNIVVDTRQFGSGKQNKGGGKNQKN